MPFQLRTAVPVATIVFVTVFAAASGAEALPTVDNGDGGFVKSILQVTQTTLQEVHLALQHLGRF